MDIAIRELKSNLSRVLAAARDGETIEVTSHRKPVARIVGIPPQADEGLRRLMATGALTWRGGRPKLGAPVALSAGGASVSQTVLEDRG
ncbi:MAG: type II toxin-antitoxin system prevent-host-death family antitoxin [Burkholderiales bacterium]|uniref:Antitoxin n=1 Tax=Ottowia pentelensis TaxID=511108 RepID=A0ABV6PUC3_9BURK|nr:type II toxin-antitoxin system prevent-host-death family antitoxin [Burkholderiales bacterium]